MKRRLAVALFFAVFTAGIYGQFTHIGAMAGYGLAVKEFGFGLSGMYTVNEQIKIVPNLWYYLPHEITVPHPVEVATQTFTWWIMNLDGNYVAIDQDAFQAYGLMGLSMVYLKGEQDHLQFPDTRYYYKLGLNVGAGIRISAGERITPFAEMKLTMGEKAYYGFIDKREVKTTQLIVSAGLLIRLTEDKVRSAEEE
jgi:hypothetical protein